MPEHVWLRVQAVPRRGVAVSDGKLILVGRAGNDGSILFGEGDFSVRRNATGRHYYVRLGAKALHFSAQEVAGHKSSSHRKGTICHRGIKFNCSGDVIGACKGRWNNCR